VVDHRKMVELDREVVVTTADAAWTLVRSPGAPEIVYLAVGLRALDYETLKFRRTGR